jgi:hypothetical protein
LEKSSSTQLDVRQTIQHKCVVQGRPLVADTAQLLLLLLPPLLLRASLSLLLLFLLHNIH